MELPTEEKERVAAVAAAIEAELESSAGQMIIDLVRRESEVGGVSRFDVVTMLTERGNALVAVAMAVNRRRANELERAMDKAVDDEVASNG